MSTRRVTGIDLRKLDRLIRKMRATEKNPILRGVFYQWAKRYEAFVRRRFNKYSRGGGDWAPLSERTIAARRGPKKSVSILRDTGTLFIALTISAPGNLLEYIKGGIRYGFGGPARHPKGKGATIADIARFHDQGEGRLPKREILAEPDRMTKERMKDDLKRGIQRLGQSNA